MHDAEIKRLIDTEMIGRWPEWEPTQAQARDIYDWFSGYSYEVVAAAVQKHKADNHFKTPSIGKIYGICKTTKTALGKRSIPATAVFYGTGHRYTIWVEVLDTDVFQDRIEFACKQILEKPEFNKWGSNYILFIGEENQHLAIRKSGEMSGVSYSITTVSRQHKQWNFPRD